MVRATYRVEREIEKELTVAVATEVMSLLWWSEAIDGGDGVDGKGGAGTESIGEGKWWEEKDNNESGKDTDVAKERFSFAWE